MVRVYDAKTEKDGKIYLNGWFKTTIFLFGTIMAIAGGITTYAYGVVLPELTRNMIANDKESRERDEKISILSQDNRYKIERFEAKLDFIIDNQNEFKEILKRTAPYERNH